MKNIVLGIALAVLVLASGFASAVSVKSVSAPTLTPGENGRVEIEIENTLDEDITDITFTLQLAGLPFIAVGSSSETVDELNEGDEEQFIFTLRPNYDIRPADYSIPYTITFRGRNDSLITRTGSLGVSVSAQPDLNPSVSAEVPVVGEQTQLTLRIVNNGLADARFVSVSLKSRGFTIVSDSEAYIGTIDSDDFETATYDVLITGTNARASGEIRYRDITNTEKVQEFSLPLRTYSAEEGRELGLVQTSMVVYYVIGAIVIIAAWFIYRSVRKRRQRARAQASEA